MPSIQSRALEAKASKLKFYLIWTHWTRYHFQPTKFSAFGHKQINLYRVVIFDLAACSSCLKLPAMHPSRELDIMIAERVLGYEVTNLKMRKPTAGGVVYDWIPLPAFSKEVSAALIAYDAVAAIGADSLRAFYEFTVNALEEKIGGVKVNENLSLTAEVICIGCLRAVELRLAPADSVS